MTAQLLTRSTHRAPKRPALGFLGDLSIPLGRVSELSGPARRTLATLIAAELQGPIFWIRPSWQAEELNPEGVMRLFHPGRLTLIEPKRAEDLLWSMEEILRSGAVPLVIADLPDPPAMTPVRRLHLATETGHEITGRWPLGLLLTPDQGGAPGVETRWHMAPAHGIEARRAWRLALLRARTAPRQGWTVRTKSGRFTATPDVRDLAET